jgi:uncharacterized protein (DUF2461 family)
MLNVLEMATGNCYCAVPVFGVPMADLMLALKLLLESDPDQFFRVANRRREMVVGLMEDELLIERVLRAREASPDARVRWPQVSMIPYRGYLP